MNYQFQSEFNDLMSNIRHHNDIIDSTANVEKINHKKFNLTQSIETKQNLQVSNLNYGIQSKKSETSKKDDNKSKYYNSIEDVIKLENKNKTWKELDLYYKKKYVADYLKKIGNLYQLDEMVLSNMRITLFNALHNKELRRNSDVDFDIQSKEINKINQLVYDDGKLKYHSLKKKKSTNVERGEYVKKSYLKRQLQLYSNK